MLIAKTREILQELARASIENPANVGTLVENTINKLLQDGFGVVIIELKQMLDELKQRKPQ